MRGSFRRGRAIVRASWTALRKNPRLLWFPVLSAVGVLALATVGAVIAHLGSLFAGQPLTELGAGWSLLVDPDPGVDAMMRRSLSVAGVVFYMGGHLFAVAMGVAMTHGALEALAGRPWTLRRSFAVAFKRRRAVATYAIIHATVGHVLRGKPRKDKRGRKRRPGFLLELAGVAWSAATYLVLPVIVREDRSGLGAIERSAKLLVGTWRDAVVARLTLAWLWIPALIVAAIPIAICAALGVREVPVLAAAVVIPLFLFAVFGLVLQTLDTIYRAALYTYASEGVVPEAFDDEALHDIWQARSGDIIDTDAVEREGEGESE